jgi:hypothetical protein
VIERFSKKRSGPGAHLGDTILHGLHLISEHDDEQRRKEVVYTESAVVSARLSSSKWHDICSNSRYTRVCGEAPDGSSKGLTPPETRAAGWTHYRFPDSKNRRPWPAWRSRVGILQRAMERIQ